MMRQRSHYREAAIVPEDAEAAALAEYGSHSRRIHRTTFVPTIFLGIAAALFGAALHFSGSWSVFPRAPDDSYLIAFPTVAIALLAPSVPIFVLGWLLRHAAQRWFLARWLPGASARYGIDSHTLRANSRLFK